MSTKAKVIPLAPDEGALLDEHELTISQGLKAFVAVGLALTAIRDGRLYRAAHKTFEAYCQQRWRLGRTRAYQLVKAAEIVSKMPTNGGQIENERQARALAAVPPHLRQEVLERAKKAGGALTEQLVTRITTQLIDERRQAAQEAAGAEEESAATVAPAESTLRRSAAKNAKPRMYLARFLDYLRLAVKNLRKARPEDLETAAVIAAARAALDEAERAFADFRLLAAEKERAAAA